MVVIRELQIVFCLPKQQMERWGINEKNFNNNGSHLRYGPKILLLTSYSFIQTIYIHWFIVLILKELKSKYNTTDLEKSIKRLEMAFCCTHRLVHYPITIREASSRRKCGQMKSPTIRCYVERGYKLEVSIRSLPLNSENPKEEEVEWQ